MGVKIKRKSGKYYQTHKMIPKIEKNKKAR